MKKLKAIYGIFLSLADQGLKLISVQDVNELDRIIFKHIHERIAELQCRMTRLEDEIKPLRAEYEAARRSEERESD